MKRWGILLCVCLISAGSVSALQAAEEYDLVIYGGTSAGVIAAVQAKKMGKSVIVVGPDVHLGGLSAGGLGYTDSGRKEAIGGLSRDFYHRVWKHYQDDSAWKWEPKKPFKSQGPEEQAAKLPAMWVFEPHVAEKIYEDYVKEFNIPVVRNEYLDRKSGVTKDGDRITSIKMLSGKTYAGKMFIDATYEGDLMAAAGVKYHVGREANSVYGETFNGVQTEAPRHGHHFKMQISPYVIPGDPKSGLLPRISTEPPGEPGAGDHRVQAYCYRMCLTNKDENRVAFPKPAGYDPKQYELLVRVLETGWREAFNKFDAIPNAKTDTNNHGPFSFDNIGYNYDYPEASYERRKEILAEHTTYQQGLLYFLANDPRVPQDVRDKMSKWGLPKDEFQDNGNWSHQIYVREARRMKGVYVMTQDDCQDRIATPNSVGMGSYNMDSHNTQRYVTPEGFVQNEGDVQERLAKSYEIAYGSITPKAGEVANLLVPVCCSSSHIAYGSIRMEPVFMILGQSAATAAAMAIDKQLPVQSVPYDELAAQLKKDGQVLELEDPDAAALKKISGVVVDDEYAEYVGEWSTSSSIQPFIGPGYRHDGNQNKGTSTAKFSAKLKPGRYDVRIAYVPNRTRASNVPVTIEHAGGKTSQKVDERAPIPSGEIDASLGIFEFGDTGAVTVSNAGTDNFVVVDLVRFVPVD
ncbi:FAD-dependent oxidoreductase [Planctomicrobium piriforme]|uniref:FAD dependent oxidoreductase n=1 Tax=Planctomicrobium piriforme TaxID=1576369 RepID=A0A1I3JC36_9PLAN|nr:FAD-dependent oxidoreductase [Planctomicrobium piriforme]SFI57827.1 FAD dependent oxidoreductase [Planctomicrobium piriforme]